MYSYRSVFVFRLLFRKHVVYRCNSFQVTLVVKQNKNMEIPAAEVKAIARRNGAGVRTYIDRACTHVICSE